MDENMLWNYLASEPDIIFKITSYLAYKDIDNLENCSKLFANIFKNLNFWKRKIIQDFPDFKMAEECKEYKNEIYWQLKYLGHHCNSKCYNLCNLCYTETHCFNITKCKKDNCSI